MHLGRLTSLRFCCAGKMVPASEAREPDGYRVSSNRLLEVATLEGQTALQQSISTAYMKTSHLSALDIRELRL